MAHNQGNYDSAANVPYWAAASVHLEPIADNTALLYENVTQDDFITNATVGVFGVDDNEIQAEGSKAAHSGWVLRTTGTGGRANRVTEETLSVVASFRTDHEDSVYPDVSVNITTQPVSVQFVTANTANANVVTISTAVIASPSGATVSYLWQYNSADGVTGWTTLRNGVNASFQNTTVTGNTTSSLTIAPSSHFSCNTAVFRARVTVTPPAGITGATASTVSTANGQVIVFASA